MSKFNRWWSSQHNTDNTAKVFASKAWKGRDAEVEALTAGRNAILFTLHELAIDWQNVVAERDRYKAALEFLSGTCWEWAVRDVAREALEEK